MTEVQINKKQDLTTLVVFYYAGHGCMYKNQNHIIVLEEDEKKQLFPLEAYMRNMSILKGSYVIAIFDCCREYKEPLPISRTRGLGSNNE